MPLFQCSEDEIKLLKRLRALEAENVGRVLLGLRPLTILEKIDTRAEPIERRPLLTPPLSSQSNQV